jgi:hypothetical protein
MGKIDLSTNISGATANDQALVAKDLSAPEVPMVKMTRGGEDPVYGDYNYIDDMESPSQKIAKMEMWIAKKLGTTLVRTYPNRQWGVQVNLQQGLLIVVCPSVSNEKGYHIHMKGDTINRLEQRCIEAAGEILERYGISRARKVDEADVEGSLKLNFKDEALAMDDETMNPGIA